MRLPKTVQEIADVIGSDRTLFLIGRLPKSYSPHYGNQVLLYVPTLQRLKPDHDLVRILGWNDAVKLCREFGGEILKPANCAGLYRGFRDDAISRLLVEGVPSQMLASWFSVCERHVRNIEKEIPQEERGAANDNNPRLNNTTRAR